MCLKLRRSRGFTLIEIMIAVAIIGILAAIAVPSYLRYVQQSHRSEAQTVLLDRAQQLERCYTLASSYANCAGSFLTLTDPARYTLTEVAAATTFTLTATPGTAQAGDVCGAMTLAHTGVKTPLNCW